ncbi:MAG TPA: carboxymuconolactone decarboxylase family protein [Anaerolineales bacterium]|nr:carboxymuconolactone decarboxylase family protein [Anaerolineales bacterium]
MKLDNRIQELIAVGASITANCQPCLQYHVKKSLESGSDEQEVAEAIEIGRMVRKGASSKMDKFAAGLNQAVASPAVEAEQGCGCGS